MITTITSLIRKVSYDSSPDTHQKYTRITMSLGVQHSGQLVPVLLWSVSRTASLMYTVWVGWTQLDLYSCIFQTHSFLSPSFSGRAFSASPAWSTPQCCRCPCWPVRQCTIVSKVGECRLLARTANTVAAVDSAAGGAKYDRSGVGAVHAAAVKNSSLSPPPFTGCPRQQQQLTHRSLSRPQLRRTAFINHHIGILYRLGDWRSRLQLLQPEIFLPARVGAGLRPKWAWCWSYDLMALYKCVYYYYYYYYY